MGGKYFIGNWIYSIERLEGNIFEVINIQFPQGGTIIDG